MKEKYKELQRTYGLPDYEAMDSDFEIHQIEEQEQVLRHITRRIAERIEMHAKLLDELFHPDTSLAGMHECNSFSNEDKKDMFNEYRRLLYYHRGAVAQDIEYEESNSATFIKNFYEEWPALKKSLLAILRKMQQSWNEELSKEQDSEYFG